jgi:Ca2+-binding RTX toxin-like protein
LTGGAGADRFYFGSVGDGGDVITDWKSGGDVDTIAILATQGFAGGALVDLGTGVLGSLDATYFSSTGAASTAAHGQFIWSAATSTLSWDGDGTGAEGAVVLATFGGGAAVTAADIILQ